MTAAGWPVCPVPCKPPVLPHCKPCTLAAPRTGDVLGSRRPEPGALSLAAAGGWSNYGAAHRREAAAFNVDRGWLFAALWRLLDPAALQPLSEWQAQQAALAEVRPAELEDFCSCHPVSMLVKSSLRSTHACSLACARAEQGPPCRVRPCLTAQRCQCWLSRRLRMCSRATGARGPRLCGCLARISTACCRGRARAAAAADLAQHGCTAALVQCCSLSWARAGGLPALRRLKGR